jgi:alkyl hydroperoxide reductase subunit F
MDKIYDLIIIGGGPAGMSAGIYGAREKLNILLITKDFGGQMKRKAVEIENYPGFKKISGQELIQKFKEHLEKFKIPIVIDKTIKVKKEEESFLVLTEGKKEFRSLAVIVASGADPRPLEVPGEKEFIGQGVSYCVTCDGIFYKDKTAAVIGGGNAGFEAALFLAKIAKKIYILEFGSEVKADKVNQEKAKKAKNIKLITNTGLKEIKGEKFVELVVYQDNKTKELKKIEADGVFIEIGSIPATDFVKGLVEFNEKDEIKINSKTGETNIPGLFAAGDITDEKYKQIVVAAAQGTKAVLSASRYLSNLKK